MDSDAKKIAKARMEGIAFWLIFSALALTSLAVILLILGRVLEWSETRNQQAKTSGPSHLEEKHTDPRYQKSQSLVSQEVRDWEYRKSSRPSGAQANSSSATANHDSRRLDAASLNVPKSQTFFSHHDRFGLESAPNRHQQEAISTLQEVTGVNPDYVDVPSSNQRRARAVYPLMAPDDEVFRDLRGNSEQYLHNTEEGEIMPDLPSTQPYGGLGIDPRTGRAYPLISAETPHSGLAVEPETGKVFFVIK